MEWYLEEIAKSYGKKEALKPTTLRLKRGIYGLLGPNGAGKSTLMNVMAGVLKPSGGRILVNQRVLKRETYQGLIGYLPQSFGCYPAFTGKDMLYYMAALKGLEKGRVLDNQISELVKAFELEQDITRPIREYSGGMKQRIGIIQCMLGNPRLMILDEPTAGLDPRQRAIFHQVLRFYGRSRIILLSTHILSDVEGLTQRLLLMRDGTVLEKRSEQVEKDYLRYFQDT